MSSQGFGACPSSHAIEQSVKESSDVFMTVLSFSAFSCISLTQCGAVCPGSHADKGVETEPDTEEDLMDTFFEHTKCKGNPK